MWSLGSSSGCSRLNAGSDVGAEVRRGQRDLASERLRSLFDGGYRVERRPQVGDHQPARLRLACRLAGLARREMDRRRGCRRACTSPRRARGRRPRRTRRHSTPGRCRRCTRAASRRARSRPPSSAAGGRCARSAARLRRSWRCRRRRPCASRRCRRTSRRARRAPARALRARTPGRPRTLEAVAVHHVQAVDVDAVIGVPVRDHDRAEVAGIDVLLQIRERAVAAVHPDVGVAGAHEIAAARAARGRAVRARTAEHGQLHDHASTASTSGPQNRVPSRRNVSTSPLVTNCTRSVDR